MGRNYANLFFGNAEHNATDQSLTFANSSSMTVSTLLHPAKRNLTSSSIQSIPSIQLQNTCRNFSKTVFLDIKLSIKKKRLNKPAMIFSRT